MHGGDNSTIATASVTAAMLSKRQYRRDLLKRQLAAVAIENYEERIAMMSMEFSSSTSDLGVLRNNKKDEFSAMTAEDIMKQLEEYCPVERPVHQPDLLNARWSFVFTGTNRPPFPSV